MTREEGVLLESWANGREELRLHNGTVLHWSTFPARDWYANVALSAAAVKVLVAAVTAPPLPDSAGPRACDGCGGEGIVLDDVTCGTCGGTGKPTGTAGSDGGTRA